MKNKNESCPEYETNSLDKSPKESENNILLKTISLLKEQIDDNKRCMNKLTKQLEHNKINYTYSNDGKLLIDYQGQDEKAILQKAAKIEASYHTYFDKNVGINNNILEIQDSFFKKYTGNTLMTASDEIEQKGLSILRAQEMERSRIACDLHDSVIQNLANLVHKTELCIRTVDRHIIGVKLDLQLMIQNIKETINDIRAIIYNLKPMALEDLGLEVAIKRYLEQFEHTQKICVRFKYECKNITLDTSVVSITLFRIIQEACSNAVKHGKATCINVELLNDNQFIRLRIQDNGLGFDVNSIHKTVKKDNSGFGLSIMKERIYLLAGKIQIESKINKGTVIEVVVPINMC